MARKPTTTKKVTKDTQKGNDQSQIESSNQSMDELVALSQEILPEQYTTIDSNKPIEAVEEESTETNTTVAPEAKVAVIASEEPSELTKISIRSEGVVWNSKDAFTTWVNKILLAARAGLEFDRSQRIRTESVPFFLSMQGTPEQITRYEELLIENIEAKVVEGKRVNVNYLNRYDFVKKVIDFGKQGAVIVKGTVSTRSPRFNVNLVIEEK